MILLQKSFHNLKNIVLHDNANVEEASHIIQHDTSSNYYFDFHVFILGSHLFKFVLYISCELSTAHRLYQYRKQFLSYHIAKCHSMLKGFDFFICRL